VRAGLAAGQEHLPLLERLRPPELLRPLPRLQERHLRLAPARHEVPWREPQLEELLWFLFRQPSIF
jgi:hypothetical protein